jgi:hypothetical protein
MCVMRILSMVLADDVDQSRGKTDILGVLNRIDATSFPVVYERFCAALTFEASAAEAGGHFDASVTVYDGDARAIATKRHALPIEQPTTPGMPVNMFYRFELLNVEFKTPGPYLVKATVDDSAVESPLYLVQM